MSLIPQSFIDELLDRVDIVEVVDHRVKLKKTGKNYAACCPFHDEKTPSFTVSPDKQFYYCFGCGASGNAVGFIMDYERIAFPEAVEQLSHLCGLEVPREEVTPAQSQQERQRKRLYSLLEQANDFYREQLRQHPGRAKAVEYLTGRGLDGHIARDYGIGYAPPGWDNLLKALGSSSDDQRDLQTAGMLIQPEGSDRCYDRFRYRIMFPIRDTRGRVIGFGGRVLGDDKPKYLNSPETPVFHKGQELYGLHEARQAYRELPRLLVVEGYMDVVSLAQFGLRYGVATLGTACSPEHLERAFRYTSEVVFCFDGDSAGRRAATRALESSLPAMTDGRQVKFLFLPEGEDPDTLVRQVGAEKFENMIAMAVPLEDYLFDAAAEGINIQTMEGRAHFSKRAAPLLAKLPKGVFKELMFDSLANRTGLRRDTLEELIDTPEALPSQAPSAPEPEPSGHLKVSELQPNLPEAPPAEDAYYADMPPPEQVPPVPDHAPYPEESMPYTPGDDYPEHEAPAGESTIPPATSPNSRYLMPPERKAMALLLAHPELAANEDDHQFWLEQPNLELRRLGRLLQLLHQRSHYQLPHILGHWRANYGESESDQLAAIAGNDLLRAAANLTRKEASDEHGYNPAGALQACLRKAREQVAYKHRAAAMATLKSPAASQMSRAEKDALYAAALGREPNE
ncbi:DNA primase [Gilvimarinus agarilyticus]|uniref:DNA primase n=1 Tax=Gilvimarinus sp. 2_MG-2023 TaxID=3062666 RepID=UPI001C094598|nr:DNA primase [Gilvimarinus sp. 2_MG-2023]MBU2885678.1 DNA primase [Gilvimarinus agarilyticus]MDO6570537.1 DNA primase [Gilvimarinus sp. 2_MG-2023]